MQRVIKIGGSLLGNDMLASKFRSWVDAQQPADTIAIVGGGEMIEAIRRLDSVSPFDPATVHWHCVELLRVTFQWIGKQLDGWQLVSTTSDFETLARDGSGLMQPDSQGDAEPRQPRHALVDVNAFYRPGDDAPLPENWTTTTDAIAGWLSILLNADELVLLKSCEVDPTISLAELARQGVVDEAIVGLAEQLPPVRLVNFAAEWNQ